jgi:hypothetical protein
MLRLNVWYHDENGDNIKVNLKYLKPRRYMCSWTFERVLKYAREELEWNDINEKDVDAFELEDTKNQWSNGIPRP